MGTFNTLVIYWFENRSQGQLWHFISAVSHFNRSTKKVTNFSKKPMQTKSTFTLWPHIRTRWTTRAIMPGQINNKRHTRLTVHTSIGPIWELSRLTVPIRVSVYNIHGYKAVQNWRYSLPLSENRELKKTQRQPQCQFKPQKNSALSYVFRNFPPRSCCTIWAKYFITGFNQ